MRITQKMPRRCPWCDADFTPPHKNHMLESITKILYDLLNRKPERGYYEADEQGWVKTTDEQMLPWPGET